MAKCINIRFALVRTKILTKVREVKEMKIAIPIDPETEMIAEQLGAAEHFRFYTEDDGVVYAEDVASPANGVEGVADFLLEHDMRIVMCLFDAY